MAGRSTRSSMHVARLEHLHDGAGRHGWVLRLHHGLVLMRIECCALRRDAAHAVPLQHVQELALGERNAVEQAFEGRVFSGGAGWNGRDGALEVVGDVDDIAGEFLDGVAARCLLFPWRRACAGCPSRRERAADGRSGRRSGPPASRPFRRAWRRRDQLLHVLLLGRLAGRPRHGGGNGGVGPGCVRLVGHKISVEFRAPVQRAGHQAPAFSRPISAAGNKNQVSKRPISLAV